MDFDNFTAELCTTNPIAAEHRKIRDNNSNNCPEIATESHDEFDEIIPMRMDGFFDANGQVPGTNERREKTKKELDEKTAARDSFLCPSAAASFFSQHHYQHHSSPIAAAAAHPQHHFPFIQPNKFSLPSSQFISANSMADRANKSNIQLESEFYKRDNPHRTYSSTIDQHQQKTAQWTSQWQHHHHHRQQRHEDGPWHSGDVPPLKKESMPVLHFNDLHLQPSSSCHFSNSVLPFPHQSPLHMENPLERTRSLSSASTAALFNCDYSHEQQQQQYFHDNVLKPTSRIPIGAKVDEQRRTKSSALPPTSLWNSLQPGTASLRRFHSRLRSPHDSHLNPLDVKPYTPPPILSPMRNGSGLFHRIAPAEDCKFSSKPCTFGDATGHFEGKEGNHHLAEDLSMTDEAVAEEEEDDRGVARKENGLTFPPPVVIFHGEHNGMEAEEESGAERRTPPTDETVSIGCSRPQRKNGFLFSAGDGPSGSGLSFAAELEQLRKQSTTSGRTHKASIVRMSIRNKTSVANDDFIRKMSTVSMEEAKAEEAVAISEEVAVESAAIPHINLGKGYQAKVKRWSERAISAQEREAIADRDQPMFESRTVAHISESALAAYETLACSVTMPKPGRNKELALNILAENQGNLKAAVMDLLRCDTLDWEQYSNIYKNSYVDVDNWSPEEISTFQDAIYKSEKDFQQVAAELGNRTVRECVSFYYTWKKTCPDDYRKLRNLRKKRQLLEQQLDLSMIACRQLSQSESNQNGASSDEGEDEEYSETESDVTNPSLLGHMSMDCSPAGAVRKHSLPRGTLPSGDLTSHPPSASSSLLLNTPSSLFNSAYPWLHGEIFPSPSSSSTSTANNDHLLGMQNGTTPAGGEMGTTDRAEGGEGGGTHHHFSSEFGGGHHQHKIRSATNPKKGAQPSADGFFHCRLCEKRFEKVKSLNAHMKSHAMKARAEAEVQMQHKQQTQAVALPFPMPSKKEADNALGALTTPLGSVTSLNLTNSQAAVAAALNNLNRQLQQQQGQTVQGAMGGIMGGNLLLRNMLQYGPAAAAAAQAGGAATAAGTAPSQWHSQNFNA